MMNKTYRRLIIKQIMLNIFNSLSIRVYIVSKVIPKEKTNIEPSSNFKAKREILKPHYYFSEHLLKRLNLSIQNCNRTTKRATKQTKGIKEQKKIATYILPK
jgi:hypothetical protein